MEVSLSPPHEDPSLVVDHPNRWCVEEKQNIYRDAKIHNYKGMMTQTLIVERRILTGSLHTVPAKHDLFTHHQFEWMDSSVRRYNEELV